MKRNVAIGFSFLFLLASPLIAKTRTPLPDTAFDGGILNAETLGRGNTIASNRAGLSSGSENPASLADSQESASMATALVRSKSSLSDEVVDATDPLSGKVLQYLSMASAKGAVFYEPLGRIRRREPTSTTSPLTDYRDIDFTANAIGFAAGDKWGKGSIGLSLAYLWSSLAVTENQAGQASQTNSDTMEGVRMNVGARFPTGPAMWGIVIRNAPGFLWGKDYRRDMLPFSARAGSTWRALPGFLFSFDYEKKFYREGSNNQDVYYFGNESFLSKSVIIRAGVFGESLDVAKKRHLTAGLTIVAKTATRITYAYEEYRILDEKVKRSLVTLQLPFDVRTDQDTEKSPRL